MKKLIKIVITCLVFLSIVGCSSGSGSGGVQMPGDGKKEKNPDFNQECKAFDFFDAIFKEEYLVTTGYNGQGDIFFTTGKFKKDEVMFENDDFQIIYEKHAGTIYNSIDFGIYHDGEKYATVEFSIIEYRNGLKNGDNVVFGCSLFSGNNGKDFEDLGYDVEYCAMGYKINGLDDRITSIKEINANQLHDAINSSFKEGTVTATYFLTLKKGKEAPLVVCDWGYYLDQDKKSVYKYSTGRRYPLESLILLYFDRGEYFLSGEVRKNFRYEVKGIPNPLKNSIYDEHTYDDSFVFNAKDENNINNYLYKPIYGLEWEVEEDDYGSFDEFLESVYSELYEIKEIK